MVPYELDDDAAAIYMIKAVGMSSSLE